MPFRLKAGLIGKINIKSSMWNLFTESFKLEISDIHFILGPNRDNLSNIQIDYPKDCQDPSKIVYDCEDQVPNLIRMHDFVH